MKKPLLLILVMLLLVFTVSGCGKNASSDTIKVGQVVSLTGGYAPWGISENNALKMEVERINAAGGVLGKKLELVAYDTKGDQLEGVTVTKRLIGEGVVAIIGPAASGVGIAMTSVTEPAGIPFICSSATNPKITVNAQTGKAIHTAFRACFIDPFQGKVASQFIIKDLGKKKVAVIVDVGSDYSQGLAQYFNEAFTKAGGTIVAQEAFRSGEIDFRAILGKIKGSNPDVIFCPTDMTQGAMIMKQGRDLGITAQFVGGDSWSSPDLISLAGPASEGSYFVNITSLEDPVIKGWINEYQGKFNTAPIMPNPVMAIDALRMLVYAIEQGKSTEPAKIIEQLEKIKDLQVLTGTVTVNAATHDPSNKPAIIEHVVNGKIAYLKRIESVE